jgi:hypothetical protein
MIKQEGRSSLEGTAGSTAAAARSTTAVAAAAGQLDALTNGPVFPLVSEYNIIYNITECSVLTDSHTEPQTRSWRHSIAGKAAEWPSGI